PLLEDKLCLIFKLAPSVCRMTFPILASLLVRLVVLLPFQLLRLSLATPSRWTQIGRASCRERVETSDVCVSLKKQHCTSANNNTDKTYETSDRHSVLN